MDSLSEKLGLSSIQQHVIENIFRQLQLDEQLERAAGGRVMLDLLNANRNAVDLVRSYNAKDTAVINAARDLLSGKTAFRESLLSATELGRHRDLVQGGSAAGLARALSGVDFLSDAFHETTQDKTSVAVFRQAAAGHKTLSESFAYDSNRFANIASFVDRYAEFENSFAAAFRNHPALSVGDAFQAATTIKSPWVNVVNPQRSFSGFAALSEIGQAMAGLESNYSAAAARLNTLIGDWTPPPGFAYWDQPKRLDAFVRSGVDDSVFEIPAEAFEDVAEASGIVVPAPEVKPPGSTNPKKPQVVIVVGSSMHLAAHDHVRTSEKLIRQRVTFSMAALYGPNWPKRAIHSNVLADLKERQAAPTRLTRSTSILDYATFGELLSIVSRKDIWAVTFGQLPISREEFRLCVERLIEVRNAVDHGRELDPMEYVWAFAEATRLQRALGIQPPPVQFEQ